MPPNQAIIQKTLDALGLPQRVIHCFFGCFAIANVTIMRLCFDLVVNKGIQFQRRNKLTKISITLSKGRTQPLQPFKRRRSLLTTTKNFKLSQRAQEYVWMAFFIGYGLSNLPGGILADKYGAKWVLVGAIMISALLTMLTPKIICNYQSTAVLAAWRFLIGFAQGPTYPALSALLAEWVPKEERGKLGALTFSGSQIGTFLINIAWQKIFQELPWEHLFFFSGALSIIWIIGFVLVCSSSPAENVYIHSSEKQYLCEEISNYKNLQQTVSTPWQEILKNSSVWALISATMQYDWHQTQTAYNNLMEEVQQQNQTIETLLPFFMSWLVSLLSGYISDILINNHLLDNTITRQLMSAIAGAAPNVLSKFAGCFICEENVDPKQQIKQCLEGIMGSYYAGIKVIPLDLSPNYAGTLMGISNSFGSFASAIMPFVHTNGSVNTTSNDFGTILWLTSSIFISGDIQNFNTPINL